MAGENERNDRPNESEPVTAEYRRRVVSEHAEGYPTAETIAEFLEANKNGGADGIKALLEKRRAVLLQAKKPARDIGRPDRGN